MSDQCLSHRFMLNSTEPRITENAEHILPWGLVKDGNLLFTIIDGALSASTFTPSKLAPFDPVGPPLHDWVRKAEKKSPDRGGSLFSLCREESTGTYGLCVFFVLPRRAGGPEISLILSRSPRVDCSRRTDTLAQTTRGRQPSASAHGRSLVLSPSSPFSSSGGNRLPLR